VAVIMFIIIKLFYAHNNMNFPTEQIQKSKYLNKSPRNKGHIIFREEYRRHKFCFYVVQVNRKCFENREKNSYHFKFLKPSGNFTYRQV
jgi:hypothetical protein